MILVDSSVWIDHFRGGEGSRPLNSLIDEDLVCVNDLILTELIPFALHRGQETLAGLLGLVDRVELSPDWENLRQMQKLNLDRGIFRVGIPDLIIAQNARAKGLSLFALDGHFREMAALHGFSLFAA